MMRRAAGASGAPPPSFPTPFLNETPTLRGGWAYTLQCVVMLPVALLRVAAFLLFSLLVLAYMLLVRALFCGTLTLARGREARWFLWWHAPVRWACRIGMFCFGVHYVEEVFPPGTPAADTRWLLCCAPRFLRRADTAPVLVANHTSFMDALFVGSRVLPVTVGKSAIVRVPILGPVFASLDPILVPRTPAERAALPPVLEAILARARAGVVPGAPGPRSQPLIVFPEGTTVNQRHIIAFQRGAFAPGVPIQPLAIEYPDADALDISIPPHLPNYVVLARMLLAPYTRMRVTYLPVYTPSAAERADAALYAEGVRAALCAVLRVTPAPHTDRDAMLVQAALARDADFSPYASHCLLPRMLSADVAEALRLPPRLPAEALVPLVRTFAAYDGAADGLLRERDIRAWVAERLLPVSRQQALGPLRKLASTMRGGGGGGGSSGGEAAGGAGDGTGLPAGYAAALFASALLAAAPYDDADAVKAGCLSFKGVVAALAVARFGRCFAAVAKQPAAAAGAAVDAVTAVQLELAVCVLSTAKASTVNGALLAAVDGEAAPAAVLSGKALEHMRSEEGTSAANAALLRRVVDAASTLLRRAWGVDL